MPKIEDSDRRWHLLAVFMVGSIGFLWIPYAARMWQAGHYQFFPLVFIAVGMLLWSRRGEIESSRTPANPRLLTGLMGGLLLLATLSNLLFSSFGGIIVSILAVWTGVYAIYGAGGLKVAAPVLALLILTVPLPMRLDESLIIQMQFFASSFASTLLDGLGVTHFRQGVILQTDNTLFLTEEACSGIRSLFSSLAVVAVFGIAMRHRWWRLLVNLLQTVFWVLVGNSIRVAVVVLFAEEHAPWIATGFGHEVLGMIVFIFILCMVASTDALLSHLISSELLIDTCDESTVFGDEESPPAFRLPSFPLSQTASLAIFSAATVACLISLKIAWTYRNDLAAFSSIVMPAMAAPADAALPVSLAGFKQGSFRHEQRKTNYLLADESYIWQYADGTLKAAISIDGPWTEWHNLNNCYRGLGWSTSPEYFVQRDDVDSTAARHYFSELRMERAGQHGYVIFSAIDRQGNQVAEGLNAAAVKRPIDAGGWTGRFAVSLGIGDGKVDFVSVDRMPVSTIQVYAESMEPWTDAEIERIRELFFAARERIAVQKQTGAL